MVRREKCPQCNKDVEVDKEIIIENPYEITILLKCGHRLGGCTITCLVDSGDRMLNKHKTVTDILSKLQYHLTDFFYQASDM